MNGALDVYKNYAIFDMSDVFVHGSPVRGYLLFSLRAFSF
jgi:hypothetical protein